jgi:hypothetical protein
MVLIRRPGSSWAEPATSAFANEKELQDLVKLSPSLLPGGDQLAVVDELWIPDVGSVDLVGVGADGKLVIVECKLRANPQIRREVVGQIFAYAGGLWKMGYDAFASAFTSRAGTSLVAAVTAASDSEVDEAILREAVGRNLASRVARKLVV